MRFVRGFEGLDSDMGAGTVVAMGNFDGVHLGHAVILQDVVARASQRGLTSCVLSFHPHPLRVVAPERAPAMLQTIEEKLLHLSNFNPDVVLVAPFTWEFSQTPAEEFINEFLVRRLGCRELHVGQDARFGRKRAGDVEFLRRCAADGVFDLHVADDVMMGSARISSSRIRRSILEGDMCDAAACLGRPWTIVGEVVHGAARGTKMGFPTANIVPDGALVPEAGVYAAITTIGGEIRPAAVHIGPIPTFGVKVPVVEAHICGFSGDLVGQRLRIHLVNRIRGIRRFDSVDGLVDQIRDDVAAVVALLDKDTLMAYKVGRFDPERR
jgi:riboflavin kinase/FMN adenylyltransferase